MCAIIGTTSIKPITDRSWLAIGRDRMRHRGPDDAGEWWSSDGCVGLGHRRLSIFDLSPAGHQPMHDPTHNYTIVFNGEIYNFKKLRNELLALGHQFNTNTDTEVILASYKQWNTDCVSRFNGMFAFALYDRAKNILFVARDRAGEKPLFYTHSFKVFSFSSELKGLMAHPSCTSTINKESLDCYLGIGYVPGNRCILEGVNKLPPAHALVYNLKNDSLNIWCYWSLPNYNNSNVIDSNDIVLKLESLLEHSVQKQLAADVPVGILLSGGVDSSLITALAARSSPQVKTFTIRFPGHGKYDETTHARLIADYFGTEHIELSAASTDVCILAKLAKQFDEPIVDSSIIPTFLVSNLVKEHCTVALGGDGGDELFGGYRRYSHLLKLYSSLNKIPLSLRSFIARSSEKFFPVGFKGRDLIHKGGVDLEKNLPHYGFSFDPSFRKSLMSSQEYWPLIAESIWQQHVPSEVDLLQRSTRMDFQNYLAEDILVKVDRSSMLNSLEMRAPMLDKDLIEFAFTHIPSSLKATSTDRKIILKKLTSRILPTEFDADRKQGFSIPLSTWLESKKWMDFFYDVLLDSSSSILDRGVVNKLLEGQIKGHSNSERLFSLVMFELWRNEYNLTL